MKGSSIIFIIATIIIPSLAVPNRQVSASFADYNVRDNQRDSICETPACIHEASFILKNMDSSIDPCENFYQFACGKFSEETVIPDNEPRVDTFTIIRGQLQEQLRLRIADEVKDDDEYIITTMKSYYQMCMDTDKIEKNSENELRKILKSLGGCPLLEDLSWDEANFDWKKTVYKANKMGYSTDMFVTVAVNADPDNSTRQIVTIDQASTLILREYLLNGTDDHMVRVHLKFITDIFELLGVDRRKAEKEANAIIDLQIRLAQMSLSKEEQRDESKLNNRMTLDQLETNYRGIPWAEYLNEILTPYEHLRRNEEVIISDTYFVDNLYRLLAKIPKRVLANYLVFNIISESIDYMGKEFLDIKHEVTKAEHGVEKQSPRWKKCLEHASENFGVALGELYVKYYFDGNAKNDVSYLAESLRKSLRHLIRQTDWMDETTMVAALEKLQSMVAYIGYPDELTNKKKINKFYQDIKLHSGSFLKSAINLKKFEKKVEYSHLKKSTNAVEWIDRCSVAEVNAYYSPTNNHFELPAGILQGHFYNKNRPKYMNYGAIGTAVGHELSHAYDDEGSQFDKNGNLFNWWQNKTREEYLKKTKCIIDQHSNFAKTELNVTIDGINTQGENIADNVGLKAAYLAYNEWAKENGKEPRLPGLNYTPQQMFWISYASNWCEKVRSESLKSSIVFDSHSSSAFRVIGPVSNLHQFSKDFQCPLGSPMNPIKKCTIW